MYEFSDISPELFTAQDNVNKPAHRAIFVPWPFGDATLE
jgi:hypothetical protein